MHSNLKGERGRSVSCFDLVGAQGLKMLCAATLRQGSFLSPKQLSRFIFAALKVRSRSGRKPEEMIAIENNIFHIVTVI